MGIPSSSCPFAKTSLTFAAFFRSLPGWTTKNAVIPDHINAASKTYTNASCVVICPSPPSAYSTTLTKFRSKIHPDTKYNVHTLRFHRGICGCIESRDGFLLLRLSKTIMLAMKNKKRINWNIKPASTILFPFAFADALRAAWSPMPANCDMNAIMSPMTNNGVVARGDMSAFSRASRARIVRPSVMYTVAEIIGGAQMMRKACNAHAPKLCGSLPAQARP